MKTKLSLGFTWTYPLESYFGPKCQTEFREFLFKNWTDEHYLKGGPVNYTSPGQMHNFHELREARVVHLKGLLVLKLVSGGFLPKLLD